MGTWEGNYVKNTLVAAATQVEIDVSRRQGLGINVTGTWVGTLVVEVSPDGGEREGNTWIAVRFYDPVLRTFAASITANGTYLIPEIAGMTHARVRCSAYTSGSIIIEEHATDTSPQVVLAQLIAGAAALGVVDTELPAAAALSDAAANPTTPMIGAVLLAWNGATLDRVRVPNVFKDLATVTITTIVTVWTPTSGKKFRLMGGCISVSAAMSVLFEDNSGGNTVLRTPKLLADTPYNFDEGNGILSAAANNALKATGSAAGAITGHIYGVEES